MITLTKEEKKFCKNNIKTIETIVKSAACSYVTSEYKEGLFKIGKKYGLMDCATCNTSIYLGTCRLYNIYVDFLNNKRLEKEKKKNDKKDNS